MARRKSAAPAVRAAQAENVTGAQALAIPVEQVDDQGSSDPVVTSLALRVHNRTPGRFREIAPGQSATVAFDNTKQRDAFVRMVTELNGLNGREGIVIEEECPDE